LCSIPSCFFKGKQDLFLAHIIESHKEEVERKFQKSLENDFDRIAPTKNEKGFIARIGLTGIYYCGNPLGLRCGCCNGYCGPDNGCCCLFCMKLTLRAR